jgi:hypothetical protein
MQKYIKRIFDSAIETALMHFWEFVGAGVVAMILGFAAIAWLWLYPYINLIAVGVAGFLSACILFTGLFVFLVSIKKRRDKKLELLKNEQFASKEKGFLDHWVNMEKAMDERNKMLSIILKETKNFNEIFARIPSKMQSAIGNSVKAQKIASEMARKINKDSAKMEENLAKLEEITERLIESGKGYYIRLKPTTEQDKQVLAIQRQGYYSLFESGNANILILENTRSFLKSLREQDASQELNTALNRRIHIMNNTIASECKINQHWSELIEILDSKYINCATLIMR